MNDYESLNHTKSAQSSAALIGAKRAEIQAITGRMKTLLDSFLDSIVDREVYTAKRAELMSRKKTLEEPSSQLSAGRAHWLEPFPNWILTAKNMGKIADSGSLPEQMLLAEQVFGSNLVLDGKKARGYCLKPWSCLLESDPTGGMVGRVGLEPTTNGLKGRCSTTELPTHQFPGLQIVTALKKPRKTPACNLIPSL